jgi:alpha-mannosidase
MLNALQLDAHRYEVYAREVLKPAVLGRSVPLTVAAMQCADPIPYARAVESKYTPIEPGWRWGPAWSTAWFHVTGEVPAGLDDRSLVLRFSSGTEAQLWVEGRPVQGFDRNRDTCPLTDIAMRGRGIDLHVEAACNHPFGITAFSWDPPETQQRWNSEQPGEFRYCEITEYHEVVFRLWHAYEFARKLIHELNEDQPRAQRLAAALKRATTAVDDANVAGTAAEALSIVEEALGETQGARTICHAVGHAHIDTAWLWPIRETRRKCLRSFSNVIRLLEKHEDFVFLCSQAQQYAWVREDAPALYDEIATHVASGRWEPGGAMWVEPDCNVPSGESFCRQILHGTTFWEEAFGERGRQRFLYVPDTFGYSAALPQIMRLAGLDTFITNKMSWNQYNEFPHMVFRWRGLDGSEVIGHCTPGDDYNASNSPHELRRGERKATRLDRMEVGTWLQPFGFGDGGGGPTEEMILSAKLAEACEGLPEVRLGSASGLCDALHERRRQLLAEGRDLPCWDGEMYLEYHRGTLTTHGWIKRANRRAEQQLRAGEWLLFAAPDQADTSTITPEFDRAWKLTLINQFHDILPGSSITWVYEDARKDHDRVNQIATSAIIAGADLWAASADTSGAERPMLVLNPNSVARTGVVECEGVPHYVDGVPALGGRVIDRAEAAAVAPVVVDDEGTLLSNGIIEATLDRLGRISSLRRLVDGREACAVTDDGSRRPLNDLKLYEDRPRSWDAWDIDIEYVEKPIALPDEAEISVVERSGLRAVIEVRRDISERSSITQRYVLRAGSPRIDIQTQAEWHEDHRLLRAEFPIEVRARLATYEVQFGHLQRPTHANTGWDRAAFEVCAHTWMDLSEPGFGVALLNDCKYGHSCHGNVMGLTLLRAPGHPDPVADRGRHDFTYSLMPHGGDWRAAGVDREAHDLNQPMIAVPLEPGQDGSWTNQWSPFEVLAAPSVGIVVAACKKAEGDDRLIVRLVETHGGRGRVDIDWNIAASDVEPVDILERPMDLAGFSHEQNRSSFEMKPFQIVTLAVTRS